MAITATMAIASIQATKGFVTAAASRLGITRQGLYKIINKYPTVKQALADEREKMTDFAEAKLYKLIKEEDKTAIIFYLKCQGKDRGYVERTEVEHSGAVEAKPVSIIEVLQPPPRSTSPQDDESP